MIQKIKKVFAGFAVYLSLCGLFGFSLFVMEESLQTVMFSTWNSVDCQDWPTVYESVVIMDKFCATMRVINYIGGWINPLTYISYNSYAKASDQYTKALRSKVLAHAPHLFIGQRVSFELSATAWEHTEHGWQARAGKITVLSSDQLPLHTLVSGVLSNDLLIDLR